MADASESTASRGLSGTKLWVLGINYAPDKVGIAPYTTQMSEYFAERGAQVAVTTGVPYYPGYRIDSSDRRTVTRSETLNGVAVRRLRHTVPRKMTALRRSLHEFSFLAHALLRRPPFTPDVVMAVTPALSGAVAAARHARRLNVPLVVVFQDLTAPGAKQSGISGGAMVSDAAGKLEEFVVRSADEVIVLHKGFTDYISGLGQPSDHIHIIRNWSFAAPAETPRDEVRAKLSWDDGTTVVLYGGNVGLKMGLENVVEAARLAEKQGDNIRFVILGDGNQRAQLEELGAGISTLQFEDPRYGSGFPDVLAAADVLLINERPSMDNMSLPSKLTYYMHSGNPVLAAVPAGGTTAQEVEAAGAGLVIEPGDPAALLKAAETLAADRDRCIAMGESGRVYAHENYGKGPILAHYEKVVLGALSGNKSSR